MGLSKEEIDKKIEEIDKKIEEKKNLAFTNYKAYLRDEIRYKYAIKQIEDLQNAGELDFIKECTLDELEKKIENLKEKITANSEEIAILDAKIDSKTEEEYDAEEYDSDSIEEKKKRLKDLRQEISKMKEHSRDLEKIKEQDEEDLEEIEEKFNIFKKYYNTKNMEHQLTLHKNNIRDILTEFYNMSDDPVVKENDSLKDKISIMVGFLEKKGFSTKEISDSKIKELEIEAENQKEEEKKSLELTIGNKIRNAFNYCHNKKLKECAEELKSSFSLIEESKDKASYFVYSKLFANATYLYSYLKNNCNYQASSEELELFNFSKEFKNYYNKFAGEKENTPTLFFYKILICNLSINILNSEELSREGKEFQYSDFNNIIKGLNNDNFNIKDLDNVIITLNPNSLLCIAQILEENNLLNMAAEYFLKAYENSKDELKEKVKANFIEFLSKKGLEINIPQKSINEFLNDTKETSTSVVQDPEEKSDKKEGSKGVVDNSSSSTVEDMLFDSSFSDRREGESMKIPGDTLSDAGDLSEQ